MTGSGEGSTTPPGDYVASSPWSDRLIDPPRVPVPPLNPDFSHGPPSMTVSHSKSVDYDSDQFGDAAFLQKLMPTGSVTLTQKLLDWKYANRRQAQIILPCLYLGPLSAAKDDNFLQETKFTFFMSVRSTASGPPRTMDAARMAEKYKIESYNLDVDSATDMVQKFPPAIKAINNHLHRQTSHIMAQPHLASTPAAMRGKVLVFCETGNERSAAVVAAYLMVMFNLDAITAAQTVQSQRFSICIDDSTKQALTTFESLLNAKRDVSRASRPSTHDGQMNSAPSYNHQGSARSKRTLDSVYDDDAAIDSHEVEQKEGHHGRAGEAPFHDKAW